MTEIPPKHWPIPKVQVVGPVDTSPSSAPAVVHEGPPAPRGPLSEREKADAARCREMRDRMKREMDTSREVAGNLVGMTDEQAVAVAEAAGRFLRLAEGFGLSGEWIPTRVTIWVEDGVVVRAEPG